MTSFRKILFLLVFALVLAGCSILPGSKKDQQITLRYWGLWESQNTIGQLIGDYKKVKPNVNIVYEKRSIQNYRESLNSQIASGKGPDIFRFHNTWVPMLKNELTPVPADIMSATDFKNNYYPTVLADLRNQDKKFVGIPLEYDGLALYWNQDIFKAAGVAAPPKTWAEVSQTAAKLTVKDSSGNISTAGIALGTASNIDQFSDILGVMILQNGGDPKSPTDKATIDAVDFYTGFAKGENRVWDSTLPSSTVAFVGGNLAMYLGPSWRAAEIKNANPLLNFSVALVPQLEGGRVSWSSYWAEGVSAKSTNQKEAWEFLKFLAKDENTIKMYSEASKTPGRLFGEPYPKVQMATKLASDNLVGAYLSDAPYARSFPMAARTFDNGLNDQTIKAYEDAINAIVSGEATDKALDTAGKNIATVFAKFGK